ncbi:hypothetical protein MTO96_039994, partial [Rhipicephalus appendiculatus]
ESRDGGTSCESPYEPPIVDQTSQFSSPDSQVPFNSDSVIAVQMAASPQHTEKHNAQTQCCVQVASKATQTSSLTKMRNLGVQAVETTAEIGCQTDVTVADIQLLEENNQRVSSPVVICYSDDSDEESVVFRDDPADETYEPSWMDSTMSSQEETAAAGPNKARKFLVYEDNLLELMKICRTCRLAAEPSVELFGSMVVVTTVCKDGHLLTWQSQPKSGNYALGNIAIAASILFTGGSPTQCLHLLQNAGIACFTARTYYRIQQNFLIPAVSKVWVEQQLALLEQLNHLIDSWHVSKGLKKQLMAATKSRGCEAIGLWIKSINNHLYFSVKAGGGDGDMAVAIWLSILNHLKDKHKGHSVLYPKCQHNKLEARKWLRPGTDAYDKVCSILSSKRLLEDIRQMSPNFQTYGVESFHAIINRFAPKCYAFSYHGILARLREPPPIHCRGAGSCGECWRKWHYIAATTPVKHLWPS